MPLSENALSGLSSGNIYNSTPRELTRGYQPSAGNVEDVIQTKISNRTTETFRFPSDLPKYHFVIIENDWAPGTLSLTPKKLIRLPLPSPLTDQFEVNYDQNFNYLGNIFSLASSVVGTFQGAAGGIGRIAGAATGLTLNTFKTVTLSVPDYRSFQFSWKLAPKNFAEAQTIQKINYSLRKAMTPERSEVGKILLKFPKIFTMYFNPNPRYLFKFKPAVLATLSVDYGGGNPFPAFYKGPNRENPPESILISTTWTELEYWLAEDYKGGDLPSNDDPFDAWNAYNYNIASPASPPSSGEFDATDGFGPSP